MYTEITFPQNNVRFIAVNSGVDSANQQDNEFVPFVNIINEYCVRDGSKKVRTSLRLKGESGEHLTTIPPYGYVKDPDNSEHWLVDPEAAQVVKSIFSLCMDGNGPTQIARMLKEDHVLTPTVYQDRQKRKVRCTLSENPYNWNGSTVAAILERMEYCGHITRKSMGDNPANGGTAQSIIPESTRCRSFGRTQCRRHRWAGTGRPGRL